jgi:hypothetical protein
VVVRIARVIAGSFPHPVPRRACGRTVPAVAPSSIRPAFSFWPTLNGRLIDAVSGLTEDQLATVPGTDRWPLWATVGHIACQRVFWLCDFAGEPGAADTPFTNAAHVCPGDEDLENVMDGPALVAALHSTFRIVDSVLDRWTLADLEEDLRREDFGPDWVHTRGAVLQRVHRHDAVHCAEVNDILRGIAAPQIELWD